MIGGELQQMGTDYGWQREQGDHRRQPRRGPRGSEADWTARSRDSIKSSGYVLHTMEAALRAVDTTTSFADALLRAVNLGDDADSVGAVTGQLAGARYGHSAIPEAWLAQLVHRPKIEALAQDLFVASLTPAGAPNGL